MDKSLVHQLAHHAAHRPDEPAIHGKDAAGAWVTFTWSQYWQAAREFAKGLIALGHQPGDCVAIVGANRPEWVIAQFGIMAAKGIPAPSYATNTPEQVTHILRNSESKIAIADSRRLGDNWREAAASDDALDLQHVICMLDDVDPAATSTLSAVRALGRDQSDEELDGRLASITHDDTCLLIYTSGTTGVSKGVMLDHGGILAMQKGAFDHLTLFKDRENHPYWIVSYLPLCHVAEQALTNFLAMAAAGQVWFCPDLSEIRNYLVEARPTVFAGVPRVWEKFQAVLESRLGEATGPRRMLADWAMRSELAAQQKEIKGQAAGGLLRGVGDKLVLSKIKAALGLDRLEYAATAAAPISVGTLKFFASIGIVVHEWFGMSETTGLATGNPVGKVRFGTVGSALSNVQVKIADDGEILLKGRAMTRGYLRMPEKTAELLDEDGWLHTGDLGDLEDGYLKITGRKKDILITAGGKNVAPAEMEAHMSQIVGVGQAVVVGDRKPYLSALVVLDPENLGPLAQAVGIADSSFGELSSNPKVKDHLMQQVEEHCNQKVARYQTIKRITVMPSEFSVEGGELTPTMKVRRAAVTKKYAADIDALYAS